MAITLVIYKKYTYYEIEFAHVLFLGYSTPILAELCPFS